MTGTTLILASASPRRRELLAQLGLACEVRPTRVEETPEPGETPRSLSTRLAREKAMTAVADSPLTVLGADTIVVREGEVLGKPLDEADGLAMLARLSGGMHEVITAVCVARAGDVHEATSESRVWFRALSDEERLAYWASGEPSDKAGAYAVQGVGAAFIERLEGSYSGVMGLPLFETAGLLARVGITVPALVAMR